MLKIRLTRRGKKNSAFFRIVVAEHTSPIKGGFLEVLGFLNPHTKEKSFKADRIKYWIEKGAQCSDTVHNLLVADSVIKGPKRAVKLKKKVEPEKKEEAGEKKPAEATEVKSEEKKAEPASSAGEEKKPAEVKEKKKEEAKEAEIAKPEPEKKKEIVEQPKAEEPEEEKK